MRYHKPVHLFFMLLGVVCLSIGIIACEQKISPEDVSHYTCPMHPQIRMDDPGSCPICGMDLVPVAKEITGEDDHSSHEHAGDHDQTTTHDHAAHESRDTEGIRIDPVRTQIIGVRTDSVAVRSLTRSLLVYGKVAHDPELWVAQNEYIEALKLGDRSLIRSAELKLRFLGLSQEWIDLIRKERKSDLGLHLPAGNAQGYFEAFIHQGDVGIVKVGQRVDVLDEKGRILQEGIIAAMGVIVDPKTRLVRALVKSDQSIDFKSNTFVQFRIRIPLGNRLSVPREAILFNGDHNMVYAVAGTGRFVARKVELGDEAEGYFEILEGVKEGETVVTNGHFLIDSETQIKTGGTSAGHQH